MKDRDIPRLPNVWRIVGKFEILFNMHDKISTHINIPQVNGWSAWNFDLEMWEKTSANL